MDTRKRLDKHALRQGLVCTVVHRDKNKNLVETTGKVAFVHKDPEYIGCIFHIVLDLPTGSSQRIRGSDINKIFEADEAEVTIPERPNSGLWRVDRIPD